MAWLVLPNKMDVRYLLVYVQEIRIQPYFCVEQGDYFFHFFLDTLYAAYFYSPFHMTIPKWYV